MIHALQTDEWETDGNNEPCVCMNSSLSGMGAIVDVINDGNVDDTNSLSITGHNSDGENEESRKWRI